jgi:tetratricopeptide (TPR) repeat protein
MLVRPDNARIPGLRERLAPSGDLESSCPAVHLFALDGDAELIENALRDEIRLSIDLPTVSGNDYASLYLAHLLTQQRRYQEARETLEAAIARDAHYCEALFQLGVLGVRLSLSTVAGDCFSRVLAINAQHVESHRHLASLRSRSSSPRMRYLHIDSGMYFGTLTPQSSGPEARYSLACCCLF